ncbi:phosphoglycerate mutase family protein [Cystoisospora suis]|uniref:Phosphoglycerate mutase family protein n=1 Tax=Cystoisospora suis TaxID=483139 RepID=A0A2C6L118_9APIC|nr:phosphoglycerate mutase family protein [Cystoisospora suis]
MREAAQVSVVLPQSTSGWRWNCFCQYVDRGNVVLVGRKLRKSGRCKTKKTFLKITAGLERTIRSRLTALLAFALREEYASPDQTGVHVDAVYSSPLSRAVESAEIICREAGIPSSAIKRDSRIMEWNAGILQGNRRSDDWLAMGGNPLHPGSLFALFSLTSPPYSPMNGKCGGETGSRGSAPFSPKSQRSIKDSAFWLLRMEGSSTTFSELQIPLHCATNAPKLNAELHLLEASVKDEPDDVEVAGLETSATDDGIQKCVPPGPDGDCGVHWSILRWGKLGPNVESKTLRTTDPPNTIEYV